MQYIAIAFAVIIMGLGVKINMQKSDYDTLIVAHAKEIRELSSKLDAEKAKNAVSLANEERLIFTIEALNNEIDSYEVDTERKDREIAEYKAKPDGEKYKKMYEAIKTIERTDNDCKRYKNTSSAFDNFSLNSL